MEELPVRLEETAETSFSGLAGTMSPCANSWMTSLAWLEHNMPDSPVLESLHWSLSALFQDKSTATTPVRTTSAGTWKTPPSLLEVGVNTSPVETTSTEDSNAEADSLPGHHSRHQLRGLSRPALEGCLESAFVIIETFSHHLCQESQRPVARGAAAEQRDAITQTPGECSDVAEMLRRLHQSVQQIHEVQSLAKWMTGTIDEMTGLAEGYTEYTKDREHFADAVREDWRQMQLDYEAWQSTLAKCQAVMKRMKEEISEKLKVRSLGLRQEMDQVDQLAKTKACLEADLRAELQKAATALKNEQKLLLQKNELLSQQLVAKGDLLREMEEQMTQMSQDKEMVERERDTSRRELQELLDCREFIEQENQICRGQLREVEEELKASRSALWERNAQLEDLKDAHQALRQEQEAVCRELATCKAELLCTQGSVEKFCMALLEIETVQAQFLGLVDSLQEEAADSTSTPGSSRTCTPARQALRSLGASFVDSVLRAVAERDLETPSVGSETSAFTKTTTSAVPRPEEVEQRLAASIQELQEVADQICRLTTQQQRAAQEEMRSLRAEILQLEHQRETLESQLKADQDSHAAKVAELSKTLNLHWQNEKELHEALCRQDEEQLRLADQRREVMHLQEEVSQLKQALRKAETETAVLWEELRTARAPDVDRVQEKIQLSQEVPLLQQQLYQARERLKRSKQIAEVMRQVLTKLDADVADISELYHLLDLLE
ncbi:UNVERIFIED_CONTAM: hypothetical protein K2H54_030160 [Gekko kuhli]